MRFTGPRPFALVGVAFAVVGVVGAVGFGWEFGGDTSTVAVALALVAVTLAVGRTLLG